MSVAFDQQALDILQERLCDAIFNALRDVSISEGILSGSQGVLSTTPPGSPKLSPQELGFISPGGIHTLALEV